MALIERLDNFGLISEDSRRIIHSLYDPLSGTMRNITGGEFNLLTIKDPSAVLGNHWHEFGECFFFLGGGTLFMADRVTGERRDYKFTLGRGVYIPQGIAHALIGERGTMIVSRIEGVFSREKTHTYKLI